MPKLHRLPQRLAFLAVAACLASGAGCCCGQGWVLPPAQEFAGYEGYEEHEDYQEYYEPQMREAPCSNHAAADRGCGCGRHHRPWLQHGSGAFAAAEEKVVVTPYPKFHPVPARPVFGPANLVTWHAPVAPPLPSPLPHRDPPPPPEPPAALPPHETGPPMTESAQRPQLLGNPQPRGSWVFKSPAVRQLAAPPTTRRTPIVEPESRQAMAERMQPIRR